MEEHAVELETKVNMLSAQLESLADKHHVLEEKHAELAEYVERLIKVMLNSADHH